MTLTTPTVAAPPDTNTIAQQELASMAALSGVLTDYNIGSQVRTQAESIGAVAEIQGISSVALALQTIVFSAMSLVGVTQQAAISATGSALFTTALNNPPPATQSVAIPTGTLVQTIGGVQFATTTGVTLLSGSTSVFAPIQATQGGTLGNVPAGAIVQLITGLSYPLAITNTTPTSGGRNAQTPQDAMTQVAAVFSSLIGGSPTSVANSVIGVTATGTNETVLYSTCFEPWLLAAPGTPASNQAGFQVYIDNGQGTASTALISAATIKLNGNLGTNTPAYRPSGVPYQVFANTPVLANVVVSGTVVSFANTASVITNMTAAISGYFALPFGAPAEQGQLAAVGANSALGLLSSFDLYLIPANDPTQTPVVAVTGSLAQRIILNSLTMNITPSM